MCWPIVYGLYTRRIDNKPGKLLDDYYCAPILLLRIERVLIDFENVRDDGMAKVFTPVCVQ